MHLNYLNYIYFAVFFAINFNSYTYTHKSHGFYVTRIVDTTFNNRRMRI